MLSSLECLTMWNLILGKVFLRNLNTTRARTIMTRRETPAKAFSVNVINKKDWTWSFIFQGNIFKSINREILWLWHIKRLSGASESNERYAVKCQRATNETKRRRQKFCLNLSSEISFSSFVSFSSELQTEASAHMQIPDRKTFHQWLRPH